ncbi:MAG: urease accessory protein UreE [Pararhodobacter sp.]
MPPLPHVTHLLSEAPDTCDAAVVLTYDERLLRRKRLETLDGDGFMIDLPHLTNLDEYWGVALDDGRKIAIRPAEEAVLVITGDLPRLAWHIGNRHTPCEIGTETLVIREDHVLEAMLKGLGAGISRAQRPFTPEKGAYGTGRTMGHAHAPSHGHGPHHDHEHGHSHG